jgi:hypothetical protein
MPSLTPNKYCFDSSAFIDSWGRYYPPAIFPTLWDNLVELIDQKKLIVAKEAEKELIAGNDDLTAWFKKHSLCVIPYNTEQLQIASEIVNKYPKVSQYHRVKPNHADPFVVALAKLENAIVVTWEGPNGSSLNPAIPDLCREHKIEYINMIGLFTKESWSFGNIR